MFSLFVITNHKSYMRTVRYAYVAVKTQNFRPGMPDARGLRRAV